LASVPAGAGERHVHLIGICGAAMASLAGMLQARGWRVSGSDSAAYPPMSVQLAALGIPVQEPFAEENLKPHPHLVVVGNAISRGNPELEYALDARLPLVSLPQLLQQEFLRGRETLVVAGTHGKTTTTAMLAWIFESAGCAPSFLVGGVAENFGSSFAVRDSEHFILEGDEYDSAFFDKGPKFLHYMPCSAILTSVEFDHADIYSDLEAVRTAFRRFVNLIPRRGCLLAWDGSADVEECVRRAYCRVLRYGFSERAMWRLVDVEFTPERSRWRVLREGKPWGEFEFALAGEYNLLNATAAAALAANYGITAEQTAQALRTFRSVKRRLEVRAEVGGVTIIEDFAHHPTAVAEVLKALRARYPGRRLWAILEPRSATLRRNVFEDALARSLALADQVVVAGVFKAESIPEAERLSPPAVARRVAEAGKSARALAGADAIVAAVAPEMRAGDVVAILSNGGFGGIYEKLPRALATRQEAAAPRS
jgi:UDP-N-acetylmuramate: L-alanyl-gamma-D-glutamyl-meso-diaminopimelate ligase